MRSFKLELMMNSMKTWFPLSKKTFERINQIKRSQNFRLDLMEGVVRRRMVIELIEVFESKNCVGALLDPYYLFVTNYQVLNTQ